MPMLNSAYGACAHIPISSYCVCIDSYMAGCSHTRGQCAYLWCICLHMCYAMCFAGVESDVDRFMAHYGINPDMYREQLLSVAQAQLQGRTPPNLAHAAREPLGASARTLQARDFGGNEEDEDEEDEEDEESGEEEEEEVVEEEPRAALKSATPPPPARRVPTTPPPHASKRKAGDEDAHGAEEWADEDEEHELLPKAPQPQRPTAAPPPKRGKQLGVVKLRFPKVDAKGKTVEIAEQFPYHENDDKKTLEVAAREFVRAKGLPMNDAPRLVEVALKRMDKLKRKPRR